MKKIGQFFKKFIKGIKAKKEERDKALQGQTPEETPKESPEGVKEK